LVPLSTGRTLSSTAQTSLSKDIKKTGEIHFGSISMGKT